MKSHVHYEVAFKDYLQHRRLPFVAVDEKRRAAFRDARLKSFDFIVYSSGPYNWLVDVKGRRWAQRSGAKRPAWENWITQNDIEGLDQWQGIFGEDFRSLLVFAYWAQGGIAPPPEISHDFRGECFVFAAVPLDEYRMHARVRSPKWGTVNMPVREFAQAVRPITEML